MALFTSADKELQEAGVRAGIRTFGQTVEVGLGVGAVGGIAVGTINDGGGTVFALDWATILGTVLFILLAAVLAGVRSYLSFVTKGMPQQYIDAAAKALVTGKATTTVSSDPGDHTANAPGHVAVIDSGSPTA